MIGGRPGMAHLIFRRHPGARLAPPGHFRPAGPYLAQPHPRSRAQTRAAIVPICEPLAGVILPRYDRYRRRPRPWSRRKRLLRTSRPGFTPALPGF